MGMCTYDSIKESHDTSRFFKYYCWFNNNSQFKTSQLYSKEGFKGLQGEFLIENNLSKQKLKIYKVSKKKFVKVN